MSRGFDWIAPYYDSLARLVFGESIRRCQPEYLDKIQIASKVLILGGGTGWILKELVKANPTCRVWYVEASSKMLEKARKAIEVPSQVFFIHGTERHLAKIADVQFDVVIANFYFDVFTTKSLQLAVEAITRSLSPGSKLLVSEFVEETWWQRLFLFVMYRFFRWTSSVEASKLPDWQDELANHGFTEHDNKTFYSGFIKSAWFVFKAGV